MCCTASKPPHQCATKKPGAELDAFRLYSRRHIGGNALELWAVLPPALSDWCGSAGLCRLCYLNPDGDVGQCQLLGDLYCHAQASEVYQLEAWVFLCVDPQAPLQPALLSCQQHITLGVSVLICTLHNVTTTAKAIVMH